MSKKVNLPLALHKRGFYYGYIALFAGTVGVIMSVPGQTMGVSVYTEHLIKSLNIDRLDLSMMYMLGTLGSAFLLPFAGRLLDRFGSRVMATFASLGLAFSLVLLAFSPAITQAFSDFANIKPYGVALAAAFFSFLGIRHFGQGQLTMASRTMMGRWFEKRRGLMLGISGTFGAFAFGLSPLFLTRLIDAYEWRPSLFILAGMALGMALFAWAAYRRSPEHCGLTVDGGLIAQEDTPSSFPKLKASFTAGEAKKTFTFWVFNLGMAAQAMLVTAVTFHLSDIARINHLTSAQAFSVFFPISVISVVIELAAGYLSDKMALRHLLTIMQAGIILALIGLQTFGADLGFALTAAGFGVSNGIFSLLTAAAWPKLFGRLHLGAIMGVVTAWMVAGSALGPYLFSLGEKFTGDYSSVLHMGLLIPASIFAASFFAKAPEKES